MNAWYYGLREGYYGVHWPYYLNKNTTRIATAQSILHFDSYTQN
jgi:hypothetical protein